MDDGPNNNNKGKSSGEGEVRYRGVRKRQWGKYEAYIRDKSQSVNPIYLGSFSTPEEAARAYDDEALKIKGNLAILNFPKNHKLPSTSSHLAQPSTQTQSGSQQENEVFEIEYYDNQLLEDLLDDKLYEKKA